MTSQKKGAWLARWFTEVPLGALGVVRAVHVAELPERFAEGAGRVEGCDRDLDVYHRLGGERGNSGVPDVVDPQGRVTQRAAQLVTQFGEAPRPPRVIRDDADRGSCPVGRGRPVVASGRTRQRRIAVIRCEEATDLRRRERPGPVQVPVDETLRAPE